MKAGPPPQRWFPFFPPNPRLFIREYPKSSKTGKIGLESSCRGYALNLFPPSPTEREPNPLTTGGCWTWPRTTLSHATALSCSRYAPIFLAFSSPPARSTLLIKGMTLASGGRLLTSSNNRVKMIVLRHLASDGQVQKTGGNLRAKHMLLVQRTT